MPDYSTGTTGSATGRPGYTTLGNDGIGLQLGAGIGQAYSEWQSGRANRTLRRFEASIADLQAKQAEAQGQYGSNQTLRRTGQVVGAQRASFAGQGVVVGSGTTAAVEADTESIGAADAAQIRANAAMQAWGYRANASAMRMQGELEAGAGRSAAVGSLLTAGARGAGDYYRVNS